MGELKTRKNDGSVDDFINNISEIKRREECVLLLKIFTDITKQDAEMWGTSIIGFGEYSYTNSSNRSSNKVQTWMRAAFSPRKQYMSIYLMLGVEKHPEILANLGKFKHGKSCLNIRHLSDCNINVLTELIRLDWEHMNKKYP